jgi:hypothetical protein
VVWKEAAVFCIQSSLTSPLTSSCLSPTPTTSTLLRDGVIAGTAARGRLSSAMTLQGHQDLSSNEIWLMLPSPKTGASPPIRAMAASPPNACHLQDGKRSVPFIYGKMSHASKVVSRSCVRKDITYIHSSSCPTKPMLLSGICT